MQLSSGIAEAVIDLHRGGRLASLQINGVELLVTDKSGDTEWGCYPMAPWAGRVRDGEFKWSGSDYSLPANAEPHALHGTVFSEPWRQTGPGSIICSLGDSWPWAGTVRSLFELKESEFVWRMEVHAERSPFPVVMGWHPWFRRKVHGGGELSVSFGASKMYVRDSSGIPTGKCVPPSQGPWDDCFTSLTGSPLLEWSNGIQLKLSSTCDHWVVYSEPTHAVCIEPQSGPPDGFNLGKMQVAYPDQPICHTFRIGWTLKGEK